ncbi:hypothetical protein [Paracoccus pacificus]|uniref:Uncharacterized protein n=1 Tax=Paracoccus pacificus TaxID=1463598 RepID=A0ABW4R815_9RHOB
MIALVLALVAAAPAPAQKYAPGTGPNPIIIRNNAGGNVMEMVRYRQNLARSGRPVQFRGYCDSACTILTTLPNSCLGPGAMIGFHAPRIPHTKIIPPLVDEIMGNFYRNGIRQKWFSTWRHQLKIQRIDAKTYARLDPEVRLCRR